MDVGGRNTLLYYRDLKVGTLDLGGAAQIPLAALGASYVLFDTYTDDAEATRHHEPGWRMLTLLAERVLDLAKETLR